MIRKGMLISMDGFYGTHSAEQATRHARLVLHELGIRTSSLDIATYVMLSCAEYREQNHLQVVPVQVVVDTVTLWFKRFKNHINESLKYGIYVFFERYVLYRAAELAIELTQDEAKARDCADRLCEIWYKELGMPQEDIGIIVADPRLDSIVKIEGDRQYLKKVPAAYLRRRDLHLALVDGLPNWHVVRAGWENLPTNEAGIPRYYEDITDDGLWKRYHVLECEVIRCLLPEDIEVSDERLMELLGSVRFKNV